MLDLRRNYESTVEHCVGTELMPVWHDGSTAACWNNPHPHSVYCNLMYYICSINNIISIVLYNRNSYLLYTYIYVLNCMLSVF